MLIIYKKADGLIASNSGTNSFLPEGPPFEVEVQNAIREYGGAPEDYGEFRLHDVEQADLVQACLTHTYSLEFDEAGNPVSVVIGDPLPPPPPQDPPVDQELADAYEAIAALYEETEALKARIAALEGGVV